MIIYLPEESGLRGSRVQIEDFSEIQCPIITPGYMKDLLAV